MAYPFLSLKLGGTGRESGADPDPGGHRTAASSCRSAFSMASTSPSDFSRNILDLWVVLLEKTYLEEENDFCDSCLVLLGDYQTIWWVNDSCHQNNHTGNLSLLTREESGS